MSSLGITGAWPPIGWDSIAPASNHMTHVETTVGYDPQKSRDVPGGGIMAPIGCIKWLGCPVDPKTVLV